MSKDGTIENLILFSMEKICQVNKYLLWEMAKKEGISLVQIQIIDHISRIPSRHATVSGIASEFELTKATISDSVNNLVEKGYLEKVADENDRRIVYLSLSRDTKKRIHRIISKDRILRDILSQIPNLETLSVADFFQTFFKQLIEKNIIQMVRMCIDCDNFLENAKPETKKPHLCRMTGKYFSNAEVNTNCRHYLKLVSN